MMNRSVAILATSSMLFGCTWQPEDASSGRAAPSLDGLIGAQPACRGHQLSAASARAALANLDVGPDWVIASAELESCFRFDHTVPAEVRLESQHAWDVPILPVTTVRLSLDATTGLPDETQIASLRVRLMSLSSSLPEWLDRAWAQPGVRTLVAEVLRGKPATGLLLHPGDPAGGPGLVVSTPDGSSTVRVRWSGPDTWISEYDLAGDAPIERFSELAEFANNHTASLRPGCSVRKWRARRTSNLAPKTQVRWRFSAELEGPACSGAQLEAERELPHPTLAEPVEPPHMVP
jgi:hypothetical protein